MTDSNPDAQAASPVHDLIRQREQLRGWLSKLGEVSTGASSKVASRVRQDYEDRLRRVTEELGLFRDEIGRDLETSRGELGELEQRRAQAGEVLEEARLRHLIGELDEEEWVRQEAQLQGDVDAAAAEAERLQAEVDRLSLLAADVSGAAVPAEPPVREAAPEPDAEPEPEPEPVAAEAEPVAGEPAAAAPAVEEVADDADVTAWLEQLSAATTEVDSPTSEEEDDEGEGSGEDLPWLEEATQPEGWSPGKDEEGLEFLNALDKPVVPEKPAAESLADDDLAFLEELDRAISGSPGKGGGAAPPPAGASATPPAATGGDAPADPRTSGGPLLCKECGAINEPHSWYCEVCGSEL